MIHGVLHLCGYRDEDVKDKEEMFARQEQKLREFKNWTE
jgi:ssRNA-specific RNase YbeY (16S rRNA maturation enzyme)